MSIRKVIKIAVTEDAKKAVADFATRHDMTEIGVASRVYQWFTAQDDVVRKGILGMLPEGYEADLVRLVLERLPTPQKEGANGRRANQRGRC